MGAWSEWIGAQREKLLSPAAHDRESSGRPRLDQHEHTAAGSPRPLQKRVAPTRRDLRKRVGQQNQIRLREDRLAEIALDPTGVSQPRMPTPRRKLGPESREGEQALHRDRPLHARPELGRGPERRPRTTTQIENRAWPPVPLDARSERGDRPVHLSESRRHPLSEIGERVAPVADRSPRAPAAVASRERLGAPFQPAHRHAIERGVDAGDQVVGKMDQGVSSGAFGGGCEGTG